MEEQARADSLKYWEGRFPKPTTCSQIEYQNNLIFIELDKYVQLAATSSSGALRSNNRHIAALELVKSRNFTLENTLKCAEWKSEQKNAALFSDFDELAVGAEDRILGDASMKTMMYIAIGSGVLLVGMLLILNRKK